MPPPGIAFDAILSMVTTAPSCSSLMPTASSGMPSPRKPEAAPARGARCGRGDEVFEATPVFVAPILAVRGHAERDERGGRERQAECGDDDAEDLERVPALRAVLRNEHPCRPLRAADLDVAVRPRPHPGARSHTARGKSVYADPEFIVQRRRIARQCCRTGHVHGEAREREHDAGGALRLRVARRQTHPVRLRRGARNRQIRLLCAEEATCKEQLRLWPRSSCMRIIASSLPGAADSFCLAALSEVRQRLSHSDGYCAARLFVHASCATRARSTWRRRRSRLPCRPFWYGSGGMSPKLMFDGWNSSFGSRGRSACA